jgi:hypothetical protein
MAGQGFYSPNIIKHLGTVVGEIAVFAAETPETGGVAAIWTINNLNSAIVAAVDLVVEALTDWVETLTKARIASDTLANMTKSPDGIDISPDGKPKWPSTVSEQFDNKDDDWHLDGEDK